MTDPTSAPMGFQWWMVCAAPLFFAALWFFGQFAAGLAEGDIPTQGIPVSRFDNVPNHSEMTAAHVAAALNQELMGHGEPIYGELHVWAKDDKYFRDNAFFVEQHGHEGGNAVTVVRHAGSRP